jgi:membrane fusion protein (multidrug efflux system)
MPTAFIRTMGSLRADGFSRSVAGLLMAAVLLGGWCAWLFLARVSRYETTDSARLEVDRATHLLQAPYVGRVVASRLTLGRNVEAGEILVELDANPERLQMQEERARRNAIGPRVESLRAQLIAATQAAARDRDAASAALDETQARVREAEQPARFAEADAARSKQLLAEGLTPEREYARAQAEANRARASVGSWQQALTRQGREQRTHESDRDAQIRALEAEIRRLEGESVTAGATIDRLQYDVEKRRIRAPIAGRLGDVATLRPGAVLHDGDKLASIVPSGVLRIVAEFDPPAALGRIRPGQAARLRLKGFPWAQYGSIAGRVATVGNEIRDGRVRVECDVVGSAASLIPAQHGLPGSVEVRVEEISPAALAFRVAGEWIGAPRGANVAQAP